MLRYEMTSARLRSERARAQAPAPEPAAARLDSPRVETNGAGPAAARSTVSPRVETDQAASVARRPQPVDTLPQELLLALASERTSSSPLARGLGAPNSTWSIEGSDLVVEGWDSTSDLFAVRDPNRRLLGWVEALGDGWGTYIQGRLIIDATDGDPWLSTDALHAVALLRAARNQQLT
ncbi:hypothetical protein BOQ63_042715 (plasmid) [Streptomyces viridifaciens]|nr:hypothetical protein CP971_00025 [Streptomyces viridifaciens]UKZ10616.1 hypothetical protein BOQ63_042715 [Streptomyces viridifaciens]